MAKLQDINPIRDAWEDTSSKISKGRGKQDEKAGLLNVVGLAIRMQVMVTFNVQTDLDVTNGSWGEIAGIVLDKCETSVHKVTIDKVIVPVDIRTRTPPGSTLRRTHAIQCICRTLSKSRKRQYKVVARF